MAEADVGLALRHRCHLLLLLALLQLVEPRLQDLHRPRLVLVLRALVLARDDVPVGRCVETHRRVGLVDVLAARPARAIGVDAQVLVPDRDLYVLLDVRQHQHRGERRLPPRVGIERRDAHQTVNARLRLRVAVRVRTFQADGGALQPRTLTRLQLQQLRLEAASLRPAQVHAEQHLGPVLGLEAARARMDLDDGVARVVLAAEELLQLERVHALRPSTFARSSASASGRTRAPRKGRCFLGHIALPAPRTDGRLHARVLARDRLRALGVVPQIRGGGLLAQLRGPPLQASQVKDASRAR